MAIVHIIKYVGKKRGRSRETQGVFRPEHGPPPASTTMAPLCASFFCGAAFFAFTAWALLFSGNTLIHTYVRSITGSHSFHFFPPTADVPPQLDMQLQIPPSSGGAALDTPLATGAADPSPAPQPQPSQLPPTAPLVCTYPPSVSPAPTARPGDPPARWAVVVQGLLYTQGLTSWGLPRMEAEDPPWPMGKDMIRILSTWDIHVEEDLFKAYVAAGFTPVLSNWSQFMGEHTGGGVGNVNLQMVTSHAGLVAAKAMGATHAIKVRGDVRVEQPRVFLECVLGTPPTIQFLTMWIGAERYAVEHLVSGPVDEVATYFQPPFKDERVDSRWPELYLMEEFGRKKAFPAEAEPHRHARFCSKVDFFYPRLPYGVYFFHHKGHAANVDMASVHTECWSGGRDANGACTLQALEEAHIFETEC